MIQPIRPRRPTVPAPILDAEPAERPPKEAEPPTAEDTPVAEGDEAQAQRTEVVAK